MKRVILKLVVIMAALFMFAGFAYASWTDKIDVNVNAGTGVTRLRITNSQIQSGSGNKIKMATYDNKADIQAKGFAEGEKVVITFTGTNTGTIPVDIDAISLYNMVMTDGSKKDDKNIKIKVEMYSQGNIVLKKELNLSDGNKKNKVIKIRPNKGTRLAPGQEVIVFVTLEYDQKGNGKKDKDKDKDKDKNLISFEFDLGILYSRFNK